MLAMFYMEILRNYLFSYKDLNQKKGFKMTTSLATIINLTRMTSTFNQRRSPLCLQNVSRKKYVKNVAKDTSKNPKLIATAQSVCIVITF